MAAIGHGRLWAEYLQHAPYGYERLIVKALQDRVIRYGITDYYRL